ncbi:MAG: accessory factor UbiK family protein [Rhodospirillales bacterium]|nr:accessory factor UbiK family protein [Rhodospirillales bacterium]
MQTDSHILDDVARVATGAMGAASGLKSELDAMVKRRLEGILAQMDLVPRDEFDAVKEMAARARSESEALTERVARLEAKLAAAEATPETGAKEAGDGR